MKVTVIGAKGHVGTHLVPLLVECGHDVTAVSRGRREPYTPHAAWASVRSLFADRAAEEERGTFGETIAALEPDAVIDLICFTPKSQEMLIRALRGRCNHLLVCGTAWTHGHPTCVPARECDPRHPFGEYGINKLAMERQLEAETRRGGLAGTTLHPGHIVGVGWAPLNPEGHFDPDVFRRISRGEEILLPNLGMETVHHVHAEDVARLFACCLSQWGQSVGEAFHAASERAMTLRGYAEAMYRWFGQEPRIQFVPWEVWKGQRPGQQVRYTWDHIAHSPNCSMEKAKRLLGFEPRWSSLAAVQQAVAWLQARDFTV
ncbi:MAG TPA: NAD-dependent epimerase/dehydratase family protein [Longimicrobiales bacterium]|nr:NAD-dependent epimerase/dehydratase family protein [Longimicrobiales bacterium]